MAIKPPDLLNRTPSVADLLEKPPIRALVSRWKPGAVCGERFLKQVMNTCGTEDEVSRQHTARGLKQRASRMRELSFQRQPEQFSRFARSARGAHQFDALGRAVREFKLLRHRIRAKHLAKHFGVAWQHWIINRGEEFLGGSDRLREFDTPLEKGTRGNHRGRSLESLDDIERHTR